MSSDLLIFYGDVLEKHPRPWRVTQAYRDWTLTGGHAENPPAIVDAVYSDTVDDDADYSVTRENDTHIIVTSSEWLDMDVDAAELMVAAVNAIG